MVARCDVVVLISGSGRTLKNFIDSDRRHATMIDWAIPQHARSTVRRMSEYLRDW